MSKIYLWAGMEGWRLFDSDDIEELSKRNISLGDGVTLGYGVKLGDRVTLGDGVTLGDDVKPFIVMYIAASRHSISWWGMGEISIGCHQHTIRLWSEEFEEIGEKEGYTPDQIQEYGRYIAMIKAQYEACHV